MSYVLVERLATATAKKRQPVYFERMAPIGPCCTRDLERAARFETREEAVRSPAYSHSLSCFEPEEIP